MFAKTLGLAAVSCLALTSVAAFASPHVEAIQPALIDVTPDQVFAPLGFDDNDNAQVVLDGALNDTCYKLGPTTARVDHQTHKIFVHQQAFYYPGGWCAEVRIPYVQTVDLGILKAGQYEILVEQPNGAPRAFTSLPVAIATSSSPDDYLYAPVSDAHLERGNGVFGGQKPQPTLMLNGAFSSSCMTFKEVKLNVRPNNVIEVLPIVDMKRDVTCAQVATEFNIAVSLKDVPHGRYLVHIRSLNGQSVNRIAEL